MKNRPSSDAMIPSVIVVSYNTRGLLLDCLESITAEARPWGRSIETIVVDNGSTDGSPISVREKFPGVTLIENPENLGFARGNNQGIRASRGDPVIVLNSDTVLMPGFFSALEEVLQRERQAGVIAPRLLNSDGSLQLSAYHDYPDPLVEIFGYTPIGGLVRRLFPALGYPFRYALTPEEHAKRQEVSHAKGACLILRRALLRAIGGFDEDFFLYREETDLCKRASDRGWKIVYVPDLFVYHHHKASSQTLSDKGLSLRLTSHYLYLKKHHGPFSRAMAYGLFTAYSIAMTGLMAVGGFLGNPGASSRAAYYARVLGWHLRNPGRGLR